MYLTSFLRNIACLLNLGINEAAFVSKHAQPSRKVPSVLEWKVVNKNLASWNDAGS
jgi:hypothetical protein